MIKTQRFLYVYRVFPNRLAIIGIALFVALLFFPHPLSAQLMSTPGKVDVSETGATLYTVPIDIPPGTAGMVPSLSLQYSSQDGDGPLGMGWKVTGLSEITRCGKTIVQDGVNGGVKFDGNDRFCLDGKRLIAISGIYGADGTEYRTEMESFSRVISHGTTGNGPAWWEVKSKSGQTLEFGNTSNSKAMLTGIPSIKAWLINKISDMKGNYVTYVYANNFAYSGAPTGEVLISSIDYTGNSGENLAPYNRIEFVYATRPDIAAIYHAGTQMRRTQKLTNIKTWVGTTLVGDHQLAYNQSTQTKRSRLISIAKCDGNANCLPATNFGWTNEGAQGTFTQTQGSVTRVSTMSSPPTSLWTPISGHFDNDGKTDVAFFKDDSKYSFMSNGAQCFVNPFDGGITLGSPPTSLWTPVPGDFDGDGLTEVVFFKDQKIYWLSTAYCSPEVSKSLLRDGLTLGSTSAWSLINGDQNGDGKTDVVFIKDRSIYSFISTGNRGFAPVVVTNPLPNNVDLGSSTTHTTITGDLNGDGRTDAVIFKYSWIYSYLSNGNGTFTQVVGRTGGQISMGSPPSSTWAPISGDLNGDGRTDVAFMKDKQIYTYLSNGDGTFFYVPQSITTTVGNSPNSTPAIGDLNGDGKTDVAFFRENTINALISKGNGTFSQVVSATGLNLGAPPMLTWAFLIGDQNGDGRTDATFFKNSAIRSYISNGDGTFNTVVGSMSGGLSLGSPPSSTWTSVTGDFNGDGTSDIRFYKNTVFHTFHSSITVPDLLTSINVPAFGATTTVSYKPLTDSTVYTKGTGATYPKFDYQGPSFVVSGLTSPNGIGGTYSSTYKYTGAKLHLTGRGFLGFASQIATDSQTGVVQTTNFAQDFPFVGMASSQSKVLGGVTLNNVANTLGTRTLPWSGTYFPYVSQSVTTSKDLDGTVMPTTTKTTTYDSYGNATQVVNSTSDGSSQTTNSTYTNDTTNWFLGRLTGSAVTNTTP